MGLGYGKLMVWQYFLCSDLEYAFLEKTGLEILSTQ